MRRALIEEVAISIDFSARITFKLLEGKLTNRKRDFARFGHICRQRYCFFNSINEAFFFSI